MQICYISRRFILHIRNGCSSQRVKVTVHLGMLYSENLLKLMLQLGMSVGCLAMTYSLLTYMYLICFGFVCFDTQCTVAYKVCKWYRIHVLCKYATGYLVSIHVGIETIAQRGRCFDHEGLHQLTTHSCIQCCSMSLHCLSTLFHCRTLWKKRGLRCLWQRGK